MNLESTIIDGPSPTVLHEVSLPILSNQECHKWFVEAGYSTSVPNTMMCAGFKEGGRDSCQVKVTFSQMIVVRFRD